MTIHAHNPALNGAQINAADAITASRLTNEVLDALRPLLGREGLTMATLAALAQMERGPMRDMLHGLTEADAISGRCELTDADEDDMDGHLSAFMDAALGVARCVNPQFDH